MHTFEVIFHVIWLSNSFYTRIINGAGTMAHPQRFWGRTFEETTMHAMTQALEMAEDRVLVVRYIQDACVLNE